jgi:hypothetical protein
MWGMAAQSRQRTGTQTKAVGSSSFRYRPTQQQLKIWREEKSGQVSYRSNGTNVIAAFCSLAGLLVMIEGIGGTVDPHKGVSSAVGIVGIFLGVLCVLYGLGVVARMGATTNNEGVVVRNWVRRRFVRWEEISGFSFGSDLGILSLREMFSTPVLATYLLLSDGRHIGMAGLSATRVNRSKSRAKVQALLDELNAQRRSFTRQ